jgi:hypothetical protein
VSGSWTVDLVEEWRQRLAREFSSKSGTGDNLRVNLGESALLECVGRMKVEELLDDF